jgi:hypothetical protein
LLIELIKDFVVAPPQLELWSLIKIDDYFKEVMDYFDIRCERVPLFQEVNEYNH